MHAIAVTAAVRVNGHTGCRGLAVAIAVTVDLHAAGCGGLAGTSARQVVSVMHRGQHGMGMVARAIRRAAR